MNDVDKKLAEMQHKLDEFSMALVELKNRLVAFDKKLHERSKKRAA